MVLSFWCDWFPPHQSERDVGASAHLYVCIIAPYEIRKVDRVPEISVSRFFIFILLLFNKYLEYKYAVHTLITVTRYRKFNFVSFQRTILFVKVRIERLRKPQRTPPLSCFQSSDTLSPVLETSKRTQIVCNRTDG